MASLPVDVLMEIFLWLSAKTLVRFRCVCKSWNSLLISPFFIKAYLERSIKLHKFYLLKDDFNFSRIQIHDCHKSELSDLDTSFVEDGQQFKLVGSCNGVVCLSNFGHGYTRHSKIYLWNPSTGENRALPQANSHVCNVVGFGFDPSSGHLDDFKVVSLSIYFEGPSDHTSQVEVYYGFRRNCWKQVGDIFPASFAHCLHHQVILENFICWCPFHPLNDESSLILFDVVKDVFQRIAVPDVLPLAQKYINLLDGCLSLIAYNSLTQLFDVWLMKEFGACESWTKLYTIGAPADGSLGYWPVGSANSGEILFSKALESGIAKRHWVLLLYNVGSEEFEEFGVELDSCFNVRVVPFIESLISLSSTNNVEH
ncbi:F-box/kelch-repeat protein At3g23880-like [Rhodamnia argentea]|uniref:F-box/kelch-repeat protein At3g23880-like n=1 Tax=Rhodamnia argentea TaxID=178133 RepID=A0A8B8Q9V1_9MYRT|nr:F-box/kelch-repeat protein At3g23880-like [Rhodamnia argentea]